jgi:DNA repair exonuclease SbcCD ATPase subunit
MRKTKKEKYDTPKTRRRRKRMKVTFTNFRHFRNSSVKINNGLSLLQGPSGSGKSTVLESLDYALYGTLKSQYSHGEKTCCVKVELEPDIAVQRNSGPGKLTLTIGNKKYDGVHAQQIINDIFGSREVFLSSCYLKQGQRCALMTGKNEEKMALIREVSFRTEKVEEVQERIAEAFKKTKAEQSTAETELLVANKALTSFKNKAPAIDLSQIDIASLDVDSLHADIVTLQGSLAKARIELEKVMTLETQIASVSKVLGSLTVGEGEGGDEKTKGEDVSAQLRELETKRKDFAEQKSKASTSRTILSQYQARCSGLEDVRKKLSELDKKFNLFDTNVDMERQRILHARSTNAELNMLLGSFGAKSVGELRSSLGQLNAEISAKKELATEYQNDLFAIDWNKSQQESVPCPSCKVPLVIEGRDLKVAGSVQMALKPVKHQDVTDQKLTELRQTVATLTAKVGRITSELPKLTTLAVNAIEESADDTEKLKACDERKTLKTQIAAFETSVGELPVLVEPPNEEDVKKVEESIKVLTEKAAKVQMMLMMKSRFENTTKELETLKSSLGDRTVTAARDTVVKLEADLESAKQMHKMALLIIEQAELEAAQEREKKRYDAITEKLSSIAKFKAIAKQVEIAKLEESVAILNDQINNFLSTMFPEDDKMIVRFSMTKETAKGERMTCSMIIFYKNVEYNSYRELSGGEGDRVSLAIMLALNSLLRGRLILLDETLNTLDAISKLRIIELLKVISDDNKLCMVISHDAMEGAFDHISSF